MADKNRSRAVQRITELEDLDNSSFLYHVFYQTRMNLSGKMVKCIVVVQVSIMMLHPFSTNLHCRLSAYFMNHYLLMALKALHDNTPKTPSSRVVPHWVPQGTKALTLGCALNMVISLRPQTIDLANSSLGRLLLLIVFHCKLTYFAEPTPMIQCAWSLSWIFNNGMTYGATVR